MKYGAICTIVCSLSRVARRRGAARRHHLLYVTTDEKFPVAAFFRSGIHLSPALSARGLDLAAIVPCDTAIMFREMNDYFDRGR
jgi:hypothetical protein